MKSSTTNTIVHKDGASEDQMLQDILRAAKAIEYKERMDRIMRWEQEGHIRTFQHLEKHIVVQVENTTFQETRAEFPTVELIAKLALAIHSGLSCRTIGTDYGEQYATYAGIGNHDRYGGQAYNRFFYEEMKALNVDNILKGDQ